MKQQTMNLFDDEIDPTINLLPYDGTVLYFGKIMDEATADYYFNALLNHVAWKSDEAVIYGKHIFTKRKVAWYGDQTFSYTYSNITKEALPWLPELLELKQLIEQLTGETFNSCLANLYHDGDEGMAWHSDYHPQRQLKQHASIRRLERLFWIISIIYQAVWIYKINLTRCRRMVECLFRRKRRELWSGSFIAQCGTVIA